MKTNGSLFYLISLVVGIVAFAVVLGGVYGLFVLAFHYPIICLLFLFVGISWFIGIAIMQGFDDSGSTNRFD